MCGPEPDPTNLLRSHLVRSLVLVVDPAEVGHDDGDGQRDDQNAAERADGTEDLPCDGVWNHVSVPENTDHDWMRSCRQTGTMSQMTEPWTRLSLHLCLYGP